MLLHPRDLCCGQPRPPDPALLVRGMPDGERVDQMRRDVRDVLDPGLCEHRRPTREEQVIMAAMTPQDLRCPQCDQIDAVSKVSGLVSSGTASYSQTHLASRLDFPFSPPSQPPPYESPWGCGYVVFIIFAGFVTFLASLFAGPDPLPLIIFSVVVFVVLVIIVTNRNVREARNRKESVEAAHQRWAVAKQRWERAGMVWHKLYYCSRNDIVFLPPERPGESTVYAPASEMERLL